MGLRFFLLLLFLCFSKVIFAEKFTLNLDLVEKMALDKERSRSIYKEEKKRQGLLLKKKYWSLLPSLNFSVRGNQGDFLGGSDFRSEFSFDVNQKIPNPFEWLSEKNMIVLSRDISEKKARGSELKTLEETRKTFFKMNLLYDKKETAEKNLKRMEELWSNAEKNASEGGLSIYDLKRLELKKRKVRRNIDKLESELKICQNSLRILLGLSPSDELSSYFKRALKLGDLERNILMERMPGSRSYSLVAKDLLYQRSVEAVQSKGHYYLPDISVNLGYGMESKLSVRATFSWKLFSGFSSYYDYRLAISEKEKAYFEFLDEKDTFMNESVKRVEHLLALKKDYEVEVKNLEDIKEILGASEKSFELGLLSYQLLDDDLASYLHQESVLLETYYNVIDALCEVSTLVGDSNFFYHWFEGLDKAS